MTETPTDWDNVIIDDFGEIVGGGTPSRATPSFWNGTIPWVTPTEITALQGRYVRDTQEKITPDGLAGSAAKLIPVGSVVVTTRASLGMAAIAAVPLTTNQGLKSIIPNESTDSLFAYYRLQTLKSEMVRLASGTTFLEISKADFSRIRTRRPKRLEQSRIAAMLALMDEAITKTEAVLAKLRQVRAGLLHDLLMCGLDANGQLRDPIAHPEEFQDSPLGRIPRAWEVATLVSRISLPQGQVDPRLEPFCDWTLLAPDHIESETGRLIARQTARQQDAISGKYVFKAGDVVYSKIRPHLRKAVLVTERGLCSADMYPLRPNAGVNSRFLLAAVLGESFSRFASAVSMRSGFPKLNRDELSQYTMGWPKPDEQNRIAAVLLASDDEQLAAESELAKLRQLKSGLITDLLIGHVRVPETV
jgi:type I restriction enzyme S subunit